MSDDKFKLVLSAPMDKRGVTVQMTIDEGAHALYIKNYPDFTLPVIGLVAVVGFSFILVMINLFFIVYSLVFLFIISYNIFVERALNCTINKATKTITYHRSGILMSPFDEKKRKCGFSEVKRLEMQQNYRMWRSGWGDTFQIFVRLSDDERLPLSPGSLGFSECQSYAERIRDYMGSEIPIKAVG